MDQRAVTDAQLGTQGSMTRVSVFLGDRGDAKEGSRSDEPWRAGEKSGDLLLMMLLLAVFLGLTPPRAPLFLCQRRGSRTSRAAVDDILIKIVDSDIAQLTARYSGTARACKHSVPSATCAPCASSLAIALCCTNMSGLSARVSARRCTRRRMEDSFALPCSSTYPASYPDASPLDAFVFLAASACVSLRCVQYTTIFKDDLQDAYSSERHITLLVPCLQSQRLGNESKHWGRLGLRRRTWL